MSIKRFEDVLAWQKAREQSILVYRGFGDIRDFGFRDQIQRAAVSVMNNIAEGFERQTNKEFRQSLYIAKGSCGELHSMLYLAVDLHMIDENMFQSIYQLNLRTSRILAGLIKSLNEK